MSVIDDMIFEREVMMLSEGLSSLFLNKSAVDYENFLRNSRKLKKNRYIKLKLKVTHNELVALKRLPILKLGQNRGGLIVEQRRHRETPFGELARRNNKTVTK